jgi:hypothetical protein
MFSQIDRIDPTILKPDPVKTTRDRGGSREKNRSARKPESQTPTVNDELEDQEPNNDSESGHVIDVRT